MAVSKPALIWKWEQRCTRSLRQRKKWVDHGYWLFFLFGSILSTLSRKTNRKFKSRVAFLSYLRLSIYMAIVSVAITVSFHIKGTPSDLERRVSKPLGGIFWVLSVVTLVLGAGNYISELVLILPPGSDTKNLSITAGFLTASFLFRPF